MLTATFSCAVINAGLKSTDELLRHINKTDYLRLVASYENLENIRTLRLDQHLDLIFLYANQCEHISSEIVEHLKHHCSSLILLSNDTLSANQAYDLFIDQFILLPYTYSYFEWKINKLIFNNKGRSIIDSKYNKNNTIFIRCEHKNNFRQIDFASILYCEVDKNDTILHTDKDKFKIRTSLNDLEKKLDSNKFIRISRTYIVALTKVSRVTGSEVELSNSVKLFIGEKYKSNFFALIESMVFSKI